MATDINITPTPGMPPVETTSTGTVNTKGSEQIQQTPEAAAAEQEAQGKAQSVGNAEFAQSQATATSLEQKAQAQDFLATESTKQAEERDRLIKANQPFIDEAQRRATAAEDSFQNFKFYDFWAHRSTGDKILARVSAALEGAGNGLLGIAGNETLNYINHAIDRDFEQQKIALHSKEQLAQWRQQGVQDLYGQLQRSLTALDMKQAKAHEATAAKVQAMALRADIPIETAKQNVIVAQQLEKAADKKVETTRRYEAHVRKDFEEKSGSETVTGKGTGTQGDIFDARGQSMGKTDADEARKANIELAAIRQTHAYAKELTNLYNQSALAQLKDMNAPGAISIVRERKQLQDEIRSLLPQVKGLNRLSEPDLKVLENIVGGNADAFLAGESSKKLVSNVMAHLEAAANATSKARGVQPNKFIMSENPEGAEKRPKVKIKNGPHKGKYGYDNGNGTVDLIP